MEYTEAEKQAIKAYYADRLDAMLLEASRCGVKNTASIRQRVAIQQDWALSNMLTAAAARFADLQCWVQAKELETTDDEGILRFAAEHLETEPHQRAIATNPHATAEVLEQVIRQGSAATKMLVAAHPNATDAMLASLMETAEKAEWGLLGGVRNAWPEKMASDHRADAADALREAVLRAQESRRGTGAAE